jgi:hypothetical protein
VAKIPRFLIPAETFDKLPKVVLDAVQDEAQTSIYGAGLILDAYAMGAQDQIVVLGKIIEAGTREEVKAK